MEELLKGGNSVFWFVVLFLPGFLSAEVYGLMIASDPPDFSKNFYQAVAFSILNFAVFAPILYAMNVFGLFGQLWVVWVTTYIVLIAAPIGWAFLTKWLRSQPWSPFLACHNKAWDYVFARKQPVWVMAYMNDGTKVGGYYAGDSYASGYPSPEQVYIQQEWVVDDEDRFVREVNRSGGVLLNGSDIKRLVFYQFEEEAGGS